MCSVVADVQGSLEADENLGKLISTCENDDEAWLLSFSLPNKVPQARAIPPREGREEVLPEDDPRLARLDIVTVNNRNQNFATRVMSNGVEVIVAGA